MLTTRELSQRCHTSKRVIRYYKDAGLIKPIMQNESGYDLYEETVIDDIQTIMKYRNLGLEVRKIKAIIYDQNYITVERLDQIIQELSEKKQNMIQMYDEKILFAKKCKSQLLEVEKKK